MTKRKNIPANRIKPFQNTILLWYYKNGRHDLDWRAERVSTYEIIIAEVLLQRTKAETVAKVYRRFLKIFPGWKAIATAEISFIEEQLKPVGLYRQRAKRLKDLAIEMEHRGGVLPKERKALEQIPFLGQYIVNAIELQIFNKPSPLLDVNMARVLERYFGKRQLADIRYDPYLQNLASQVTNLPNSKDMNWAILDFAAAICKARNPLCLECPINSLCKYFSMLHN